METTWKEQLLCGAQGRVPHDRFNGYGWGTVKSSYFTRRIVKLSPKQLKHLGPFYVHFDKSKKGASDRETYQKFTEESYVFLL